MSPWELILLFQQLWLGNGRHCALRWCLGSGAVQASDPGLAVVSQVDQLLGHELLPAQGALRLGVTPLRDALPAEEVTTRCGGRVAPLLQAQRAHRVPGSRSVLGVAPALRAAAGQRPLSADPLPLPEAVELQA